MLRIVGLQRSESADKEFLLMQNQGSLRVNLRGHVLMSEVALDAGDLCNASHVFTDEAYIQPGLYVLLTTGEGDPHWAKTRDGAHVFHAYIGRRHPLWTRCDGPLHVLSPHHTYAERGELLLLR